MAEAIGLASSQAALAGFALQASKSLHQVLESFKSTKRTVRELRHELDALNQVIYVAVDHEKDLSTLKLPLLRCGKTCEEYEDVIESVLLVQMSNEHESLNGLGCSIWEATFLISKQLYLAAKQPSVSLSAVQHCKYIYQVQALLLGLIVTSRHCCYIECSRRVQANDS